MNSKIALLLLCSIIMPLCGMRGGGGNKTMYDAVIDQFYDSNPVLEKLSAELLKAYKGIADKISGANNKARALIGLIDDALAKAVSQQAKSSVQLNVSPFMQQQDILVLRAQKAAEKKKTIITQWKAFEDKIRQQECDELFDCTEPCDKLQEWGLSDTLYQEHLNLLGLLMANCDESEQYKASYENTKNYKISSCIEAYKKEAAQNFNIIKEEFKHALAALVNSIDNLDTYFECFSDCNNKDSWTWKHELFKKYDELNNPYKDKILNMKGSEPYLDEISKLKKESEKAINDKKIKLLQEGRKTALPFMPTPTPGYMPQFTPQQQYPQLKVSMLQPYRPITISGIPTSTSSFPSASTITTVQAQPFQIPRYMPPSHLPQLYQKPQTSITTPASTSYVPPTTPFRSTEQFDLIMENIKKIETKDQFIAAYEKFLNDLTINNFECINDSLRSDPKSWVYAKGDIEKLLNEFKSKKPFIVNRDVFKEFNEKKALIVCLYIWWEKAHSFIAGIKDLFIDFYLDPNANNPLDSTQWKEHESFNSLKHATTWDLRTNLNNNSESFLNNNSDYKKTYDKAIAELDQKIENKKLELIRDKVNNPLTIEKIEKITDLPDYQKAKREFLSFLTKNDFEQSQELKPNKKKIYDWLFDNSWKKFSDFKFMSDFSQRKAAILTG